MADSNHRIGLGHDTHRLVSNRKLILGGVPIEFDRGPDSHSDGDVLLHALTDALLGAVGLGDIGEWFPNNDERWIDAESSLFVTTALDAVKERGWKIANLDCTVFLEKPKLSTYKPEIKSRLAELLCISEEFVNVKAKSGEQVGPVGRGEAIVADAIVLLTQEDS